MVKSMFAGVAGLRAHQQKMDVIGNNIANVNTPGYKCATYNFKESLYSTSVTGSTGNTEKGGMGGINTSQVGYGTSMGSITRDYTKGSPTPTGRGLDAMIDGTGYFIVGSYEEKGELALANVSSKYLTRVGIFAVDGKGFLVDSQGNYVYGYEAKSDGTIANKSTDGLVALKALGFDGTNQTVSLQSFTIDGNGVLTGVDEEGNTHTCGQLALATVPNPGDLQSADGYYYNIGANAGKPNVNAPGKTAGIIRGGFLEMPNVDLAQQFSEMITTQRGFQANSKIITVTDEMLQELVNMKR